MKSPIWTLSTEMRRALVDPWTSARDAHVEAVVAELLRAARDCEEARAAMGNAGLGAASRDEGYDAIAYTLAQRVLRHRGAGDTQKLWQAWTLEHPGCCEQVLLVLVKREGELTAAAIAAQTAGASLIHADFTERANVTRAMRAVLVNAARTPLREVAP